jgi:hypothetical protein
MLAPSDIAVTVHAGLLGRRGEAGLLDGPWLWFERVNRESTRLFPPALADRVRRAALPKEPSPFSECAQRANVEAGAGYLRSRLAEEGEQPPSQGTDTMPPLSFNSVAMALSPRSSATSSGVSQPP